MDPNDFLALKSQLLASGVTVVAVSKTQPIEAIMNLYNLGQRVFGENRVQELLEKQRLLPPDIQWHLIGHLQTNKVRQIISHVAMIESADSVKLLRAIQKEAASSNAVVDVLLQIKIASEPTKYGFDPLSVMEELGEAGILEMMSLRFRGVMGMASFIDDEEQVRHEFNNLRSIFQDLRKTFFQTNTSFDQISMGMSGDYSIAIEEGSTMVRIGSLIFGQRGV